jgi:outer membrane protein assembly factor BamB
MIHMSTPSRAALAFLAAVLIRPAAADDWPQFGRDRTRNPVSPEKNPPTWWQFEERDGDKVLKEGKNVRWAADLGTGNYGVIYGDPVVVDGMVWVGSNHFAHDKKENLTIGAVLVCLDEKTGKELYRRVDARLEGLQGGRFSSHASSPLIEGDRLWVVTNRCEVVCLDIGPLKRRAGEPREEWKIDMRKDLGVQPRGSHHQNRRCSVASYKDLIYVLTGNGVQWEDGKRVVAADAPSLVCFEKTTGKVVWKDTSPGKNILFGQFASPTVIEAGGRVQVVAPQGDGWLRSFDAATGKPIWQFDTNPPDATYADGYPDNTRNDLPATAVFYEGRVYIGNGQEMEVGSGVAWLYCIDPTKAGDISPEFTSGPNKGKPNSNSGMVWKYGGVDEMSTPNRWGGKAAVFGRTLSNVAIDKGLLIATDIGGTVHCLDAKTGHMYWRHTIKSAEIHGSPLIVGGKVYVATTGSGYWVFDLAKEKKVVASIETEVGGMCSPVFANGMLYVATGRSLWAVVGNEKPGK